MSTISLRLPESLHEAARALAERENSSINQLVTLALAEKISALMTEEYCEKRAKGASQAKFRRALKKVSTSAPKNEDRL